VIQLDRQKPNISIIVPIYNVEPYLRRCVDSLLGQTYADFELILVDDGSPDNCGAICDEYAAMDARVRVIHKPNGGLSDARNAGMEIAQGKYIAFVDSDDWAAPDYLERMLEAMQKTGADICECDILRTYGEEDVPPSADTTPAVFETEKAMSELINDGVFHQYVWNKLYRREIIGDVLFPKGKTNEDEFWTYQIFGNAEKVVKIPDVLYFYFQRPGSIMGQTYSLKRLDALEAKLQRQRYLDAKFPQLSLQAKLNLFGSCIYAGQMSLMHLSGEQQAAAKVVIMKAVRQCGISLQECIHTGGSNKVWFPMAKCAFWGTCALKNLLKKGI
jgi:glycosyltransferase involved in cell wall biosynthesis